MFGFFFFNFWFGDIKQHQYLFKKGFTTELSEYMHLKIAIFEFKVLYLFIDFIDTYQ